MHFLEDNSPDGRSCSGYSVSSDKKRKEGESIYDSILHKVSHTGSWPIRELHRELVKEKTKESRDPWLIYTCGQMGAGKGHVMRLLDKGGFLNLNKISQIDPDRFREVMPEWKLYQQNPKTAGRLTQKEAGMIAEIAQEIGFTFLKILIPSLESENP